MRQVIKTKYIGPTNTKGSRIKASCGAGSKTIQYRDELSIDKNHKLAIDMLFVQLGWDEKCSLVYGWDKHSMVAIQVPKKGKE